MMELIQTVLEWYMANLNYFTVCLLMTIESSFIPFPSEAIVPFAAWKAAQGDLNIFLVVLSASVGALIGALFNYYFALYLGRPLVYRFAESKLGKVFLLSKEKVANAESYFVKHGKTSTLIGRLVPVIRQLISIPAGLARMNLRDFVIYTVIGATLWNLILAVIGYFLYEIRDQIYPYLTEIFIVIGVLFAGYLIFQSWRRRNKQQL